MPDGGDRQAKFRRHLCRHDLCRRTLGRRRGKRHRLEHRLYQLPQGAQDVLVVLLIRKRLSSLLRSVSCAGGHSSGGALSARGLSLRGVVGENMVAGYGAQPVSDERPVNIVEPLPGCFVGPVRNHYGRLTFAGFPPTVIPRPRHRRFIHTAGPGAGVAGGGEQSLLAWTPAAMAKRVQFCVPFGTKI